jgi:hypothetical protein
VNLTRADLPVFLLELVLLLMGSVGTVLTLLRYRESVGVSGKSPICKRESRIRRIGSGSIRIQLLQRSHQRTAPVLLASVS